MRSSENLLCSSKTWLALLVCGGLAAHGPARDTCLIGEEHSVTLVGSSESDEVLLAAPANVVSRLVSTLRNETEGISIRPTYMGEVFTNARGGLSTNDATQYQALLDLVFEFDFDDMGLALPGKFLMLAQNTHGRLIS